MRRRHAPAAANDRREAVRMLRVNLLATLEGVDHPTVLVTSPGKGAGKTTTCAELAESLAGAGLRVAAVDLVLHAPELHRWLGAAQEPGVCEVLVEGRPLEQCLQTLTPPPGTPSRTGSLRLLAAGPGVSSASEVLTAEAVEALLGELAAGADIVLLDGSAVLDVADTAVVGRVVSGAVLVLEARRTQVADALEAARALTRHHTRLLGVVVNKIRPEDQIQRARPEPSDGGDVMATPAGLGGPIP